MEAQGEGGRGLRTTLLREEKEELMSVGSKIYQIMN